MKRLPFVKKLSFANHPSLATMGSALVLSSLLLTACATPEPPSGALDARTKLEALQSNPEIARHARVELREAEQAVRTAEQPLDRDKAELAEHRVYMADRMVEIAEAKAGTRKAESDRERISEQREAARLASRTREADRAQADARSARRSEGASAREAEALQRQISELQAQTTERGLVLTLGDVLFASGSADIQGGSNRNLEKLVEFLDEHPERDVQIEGHTDNVGSAEFNRGLSKQRAESVREYLTDRGIERRRISVSGLGLENPIADNETQTGRQQNRRVEVIIEN